MIILGTTRSFVPQSFLPPLPVPPRNSAKRRRASIQNAVSDLREPCLGHDVLLSKGKNESRVLTVWGNSFNLLEDPNYVAYIGRIGSPLFGKPVAAQPPRCIELDVPFKFCRRRQGPLNKFDNKT